MIVSTWLDHVRRRRRDMSNCKALFCIAEDHGDDPNSHVDCTGYSWEEDVLGYEDEIVAHAYDWPAEATSS
jgi:hypothetical protein